MPYSDLYPEETAAALLDLSTNPLPPLPKKRSAWAAVGDLVSAPLTGFAQGVNETFRVANRVLTTAPRPQAEPPEGASSFLYGTPQQREARRASQLKTEALGRETDADLRRNIEYWRPDPQTANAATTFVHEMARVLTKAAGYNALGGTVGMVAGTGADEAGTTYLNLRDQGVDEGTAAKVGGVHGAATAVSIGVPAVGSTWLRSMGLLAVSGPGAYVAESALSRDILESAQYPHLAAQFDPTDPAGLLLSTVPGGVIATALHAARARRAGRGGTTEPPSSAPAADVMPPEAVEAAHVHLQREFLESSQVGRMGDPEASATHARALDEARAAMDEGRPMALPRVELDEVHGVPRIAEMVERLRAADVPRLVQEEASARAMDLEPLPAPGERSATAPATGQPTAPAQAAPGMANPEQRAPIQRALEVAAERPDLPVRLEDDGPATPASDLVRTEAGRATTEARETGQAVQAAIECFLKLGVD